MAEIVFDKPIYVKDRYGVKRQAFMPNMPVEDYVVAAILRKEEVLNPEDLPKGLKPEPVVVGEMEVKVLPKEEVKKEVVKEVEVKESEAVEVEEEVDEKADKPKDTKKGKK